MLPLLLLHALGQQAAQVPTAATPASPNPEQVVARLNGEEIKAKDVEAYLWDWRGSEVTNDYITYRLIQTEAKKLNVQVPPEEVEKSFATQMETMKASLQPGQELDSAMRQQGFPRSRLYLRVHTDLLLNQIILKQFKQEEYVRVSTIAFNPKSEAASDLTAAIGRAQGAYQRLQKGGDWNKEVAASDDDDALKQHKGLLGWRLRRVFPANTQTELESGPVGTLAKPTQAAGAIQVFRIEGHGKDVKGSELESLKQAYLATGRQDVIERLRKEAKIERLFPAPK